MRLGITCGGGTPTDRVVDIVTRAEDEGFSAVWFPNGGGADALPAMAVAGRATERIELGTAIQQTYPCHPILAAQRAAAVADAMGRPGFTLGLGPGHRPHIEGVYREDYDHVGQTPRSTSTSSAGCWPANRWTLRASRSARPAASAWHRSHNPCPC